MTHEIGRESEINRNHRLLSLTVNSWSYQCVCVHHMWRDHGRKEYMIRFFSPCGSYIITGFFFLRAIPFFCLHEHELVNQHVTGRRRKKSPIKDQTTAKQRRFSLRVEIRKMMSADYNTEFVFLHADFLSLTASNLPFTWLYYCSWGWRNNSVWETRGAILPSWLHLIMRKRAQERTMPRTRRQAIPIPNPPTSNACPFTKSFIFS